MAPRLSGIFVMEPYDISRANAIKRREAPDPQQKCIGHQTFLLFFEVLTQQS